jgi:ankyrin repeat protein
VLSSKIDLDKRDPQGRTLLLETVLEKRLDLAKLLLEHGADPNVRASIWKRQNRGHDRTMTRHDYRSVTPLSYGRRFHDRIFVSEPAMRRIEAAGGVE